MISGVQVVRRLSSEGAPAGDPEMACVAVACGRGAVWASPYICTDVGVLVEVLGQFQQTLRGDKEYGVIGTAV